MSRKHKFDLTNLAHRGHLNDGQTLFFVSDPNMNCVIKKQPNGEYKVSTKGETQTIHAFAQKCLGTDPPDHAAKWIRNQAGKTLYELWQAEESAEAA